MDLDKFYSNQPHTFDSFWADQCIRRIHYRPMSLKYENVQTWGWED